MARRQATTLAAKTEGDGLVNSRAGGVTRGWKIQLGKEKKVEGLFSWDDSVGEQNLFLVVTGKHGDQLSRSAYKLDSAWVPQRSELALLNTDHILILWYTYYRVKSITLNLLYQTVLLLYMYGYVIVKNCSIDWANNFDFWRWKTHMVLTTTANAS